MYPSGLPGDVDGQVSEVDDDALEHVEPFRQQITRLVDDDTAEIELTIAVGHARSAGEATTRTCSRARIVRKRRMNTVSRTTKCLRELWQPQQKLTARGLPLEEQAPLQQPVQSQPEGSVLRAVALALFALRPDEDTLVDVVRPGRHVEEKHP